MSEALHHGNYRRGMSHDANGYVTLSSREHGKDWGRREHRVIAESMVGRTLNDDEVVHHRNGDKADNRPANLQVMSRAEHARIHHAKGRWIACRTCGAERWHSPAAEARVAARGYACRPCGGRYA